MVKAGCNANFFAKGKEMIEIPHDAKPLGYKALVDFYDLKTIPHWRWSYVVQRGSRHIIHYDDYEYHLYPKKYFIAPDDTFSHVTFALRHEGVNVAILIDLFGMLSEEEIVRFIKSRPSGKYTRIFWYFYELLLAKRLPIDDAQCKSYCTILDESIYYVSKPRASKRHYVYDNLLGNRYFCPLVRKTELLKKYEKKNFDEKSKELLARYDRSIIRRAVQYLYTKETMSSYQIERERPSKQRAARFAELLQNATHNEVPLSQNALVNIQKEIIDERFVETGVRTTQNYVGQRIGFQHQKIHYISPKPDDVHQLILGLQENFERMVDSNLHPVVIATIISFGFVYVHPFEDANGRISRFLIHAILANRNFVSEGLIFPVSAVMLAHQDQYDQVLEHVSKPLLSLLDYTLSDDGVLSVQGSTVQHYRYLDYTKQAEFLFWCIEQTIESELKNELVFIVRYDKTRNAIQDIVDMPDKMIDLIIRCIQQEQGRLSAKKRKQHFSMLTDEEIRAIEDAVQKYLSVG